MCVVCVCGGVRTMYGGVSVDVNNKKYKCRVHTVQYTACIVYKECVKAGQSLN